MATVVNSRDLKLQATSPRFTPVRPQGIYLVESSDNFIVAENGTAAPSDGITYTLEVVGVTATADPVFSVTAGTATLTDVMEGTPSASNPRKKQLLFSDMLSNNVIVTATLTDITGAVFTSEVSTRKIRESSVGVGIASQSSLFRVDAAGSGSPAVMEVYVAPKFLEFDSTPVYTLTAIDSSGNTIPEITLVPDAVKDLTWLLDYDEVAASGELSFGVKVSVTDKYSITYTDTALIDVLVEVSSFVRISSTSPFFVKPKTSSILTPSTVKFTAVTQGVTDPVSWVILDQSSTPVSFTTDTDTNGNATATVTNSQFGNSTLATVTATAGAYSDTTTVQLVDEAVDGVFVAMANSLHEFDADAVGSIYSFVGSGSTFTIYEGSNLVSTYDSSFPYSLGSYRFGVPTAVTDVGSISAPVLSSEGLSNYSSMSANTATVTIPVIVTKLDGSVVTVNVSQTLVKKKRGAVLSLSSTASSFAYNSAGATPAPTSATVTALVANISPTLTTWYSTITVGAGAESARTANTGASKTYTYTPQAAYSNMPQTVTVKVYDTASGGNLIGTASIGMAATRVGDTGAAGSNGANGTNGVNGTRTAVLELYRWSASAPTTFPVGDSTYTWATGQFTNPATLNSWTQTPGTPVAGQVLYVVRQLYADSLTAATSSVTWAATTSVPSGAAGADGAAGANGQRVGVLEVYLWSASAPTSFPSGTSTYTWATGAFTAPSTPNGWSLVPGAPVAGQTLWGISVSVSDNLVTPTSSATWASSSPYAVGAAGSNGSNGADGTNGVNGTRTAVLELYRWSASAPTTFPSGSSTYTWATGQFTNPATLNSWTQTPGTPVAGQVLYVVRQLYADSLTAATSSVTWAATTSVPSGAAGADGAAGANGQRVGVLEVYLWSASAPTSFPSGTSTYTWATGVFTAPSTPNGWSLVPGAPVAGQTLWGISVSVSDNLVTPTSSATWASSSPYAVGAAGSNGSNGADGTNGTPGVNALNVYLTRESYTVPSLQDGTGYTSYLSLAGGTFKVNFGTTDVTTSSIFNIVGGTDAGTTWTKVQNGLTFTISETTGAYSVSGASWTTDSESFTVTASYLGTTGTKTYTITKAKQGLPGKKTVTVKLFKWDTSAAIPDTDSSYNWATNVLSLGTVIGWFTTAPSSTASGQKLYELSKLLIVDVDYTGLSTVDWNTADGVGPIGAINEIGIRQDGSIGPIGPTGPRGQSGYVYYTAESASAPTPNPSATSFDFSTGAFTGLTASWATTYNVPSPTATTANEKYWSARYVVTEATFGGVQTITFSAPFVHTNFDGLVTFTNLTGGTNGSGTSTTYINGGAITASTVTADKMSVTTLSSIQSSLGTVDIATAGHVRSGKTSAGDSANAGFFLGYTSPTYTFFIGNAGDTVSLKYDGNLTMKGGTVNVGTTGAVYGGQTAFDTGEGFYLGYSASAYKFSVGGSDITGITVNISTDVFSKVSHGLTNGKIVRFSNVGDVSNMSTTYFYYVMDATADTFKVAEYLGGAALNLAGTAASPLTIAKSNLAWDGKSLVMNSGVISGAFLRTATSGGRVEVGGRNDIVVWNSAGESVGQWNTNGSGKLSIYNSPGQTLRGLLYVQNDGTADIPCGEFQTGREGGSAITALNSASSGEAIKATAWGGNALYAYSTGSNVNAAIYAENPITAGIAIEAKGQTKLSNISPSLPALVVSNSSTASAASLTNSSATNATLVATNSNAAGVALQVSGSISANTNNATIRTLTAANAGAGGAIIAASVSGTTALVENSGTANYSAAVLGRMTANVGTNAAYGIIGEIGNASSGVNSVGVYARNLGSGKAIDAANSHTTSATITATNSATEGIAIEAIGRVEASKTLRVTGIQPPSSGVGLELAYLDGIGYVVSYNRSTSTAKPLHMISSETVLGGVVNVPATATSAGTQGQIAWDANFAYFCTAPNTWRRAALSTW